MNNTLQPRNPWIGRFILFLVFALLLIFRPTQHLTAFAQSDSIIPTIYCVGGSGVPPCQPIPSVSASDAGSPSTAGGSTAPGTSNSPSTAEATSPGPSVSPCTGTTSILSNNSKQHRKWRRKGKGGGGGNSGGSGFFEQLIQWLIKLIEQLLGGSGGSIPSLPTPGNPTPSTQPPCPGTSTAPSSGPIASSAPTTSTAPATSTAPVTSTAPGTSIIPSVLAPSAAAGGGTAGAATCGGSANTPSSPVTGYKISGCEDFTSGLGVFSPYDGGGGDTVVGGGRKTSQCTVTGGILSLTQTADGSTCGGSMSFAQKYGYWEVRMRAYTTGTGSGSEPHPVLILWPTTDKWPDDGELDYFETDIGSPATGFLHCASSAGGNCVTLPDNSVDYSQWHTYGFEWTASGFTGWIDGKLWYTSTDSGPQSTVTMQQTIQLDNLSGNTPVDPAKMDIDWVHMYTK